MADMKDSFITIGDHRICYWDTGAKGDPIVFVHGNSAAKNSFEHLFAGDLARRHRLVALDLPGHGASDWRPDYTGQVYIDAVRGLLEALKLKRPVLVGHSLGGNIVIEGLSEMKQAAGAVIFGTPPLGKPPQADKALLPHPSAIAFFTAELSEQDYRNWADTCFASGFTAPEHFVQNIRKADPKLRSALLRDMMTLAYRDEIECIQRSSVPFAILHGEHENTISLDYLRGLPLANLWTNDVVVLPGTGHSPHIENPALFAAELERFVASLPQRVGEAPPRPVTADNLAV